MNYLYFLLNLFVKGIFKYISLSEKIGVISLALSREIKMVNNLLLKIISTTGERIARDSPEIADYYRQEMCMDSIVEEIGLMNRYRIISKEVARNCVAKALEILIQDTRERRKLGLAIKAKVMRDVGKNHYANKTAIYGLSAKEKLERDKKAARAKGGRIFNSKEKEVLKVVLRSGKYAYESVVAGNTQKNIDWRGIQNVMMNVGYFRTIASLRSHYKINLNYYTSKEYCKANQKP